MDGLNTRLENESIPLETEMGLLSPRSFINTSASANSDTISPSSSVECLISWTAISGERWEKEDSAGVDLDGGDADGDEQESTRVAEDEDGTKGDSGDVGSNGGNHAGEDTEVGRDGADGDETTEANVG